MSRILIVEDEKKIARFLELELTHEGYEVQTAGDGRSGLEQAQSWQPDLLILDLMLPELSGIEVCRRLRHESDVPIIMLTAKDDVSDKVMGLDMGADDYIRKPFRPRELLSRIRSVLRRSGRLQSQFVCAGVALDASRGVVTRNGAEVPLSALEYRLLLTLFSNRGTVLPRERLLSEIWDASGEFVNDNTLTVYIKRLREKLEDDPQSPALIRTVRGVGYRLGP